MEIAPGKNFDLYIVHIDDDKDDLDMMAEMVAHLAPAIGVHSYDKAAQALSFFDSLSHETTLPSIIIVDLNMPIISGLEVLEIIKNNSLLSDIPVFMLTNSDHPQHRKSCIASGAVDFTTKPYNRNDLEKICREILTYVNPVS